MKKVLFVILACFMANLNLAQQVAGGVAGKGMDMNARPGGIVQQISLEEPKLLGNTYIDDIWFRGSLFLFSGHKIENYPLRYDIKNHVVEIRIEDEDKVKVLQGIRIQKFEWFNSELNQQETFVNSSVIDASVSSSFFKILLNGDKIDLLMRYRVKLLKGNYVQALDMGKRDHRLVKVKEFYFQIGEDLVETPNKRKKLQPLFPDSFDEIKSYINIEKIRLKEEVGLIKLTEFINNI